MAQVEVGLAEGVFKIIGKAKEACICVICSYIQTYISLYHGLNILLCDGRLSVDFYLPSLVKILG